jgi:dTMP kinase
MAYQIYGRRRLSLGRAFYQLNRIATGGLEPDLVIYLDVEPKVGLERKANGGGRSTRFDRETLDFHQCVRRGFLDQCRQNPKKWVRIDTTGVSKKEVQERVWQIVRKKLGI